MTLLSYVVECLELQLCSFYEQYLMTVRRISGIQEVMKVSDCSQFRSDRADDTKISHCGQKRAGQSRRYPKLALACNHFGMNKFDSAGDTNYQTVRGR